MDSLTPDQLAQSFAGEPHEVQGFKMLLSSREHIQRRLIEDGVHEWAETALLPTFVRRGWTVCDVGANIGYYSLLLSRLVGEQGRVLAFEPNPVLLGKLRRHAELNARNIEICPVALSAGDALRRFNFAPELEGGGLPNFGGWSLLGAGLASDGLEIRFTTLDALVAERKVERVRFVKADIEGGELELLQGASTVLEKHRPFWMLEFKADDEAERARLAEIRDLLEARRYTVCRIVKKPWPHLARLTDADLALPAHFNALAYFGSYPIHP